MRFKIHKVLKRKGCPSWAALSEFIAPYFDFEARVELFV